MTSVNEGISVTINEHSIESVSAQKHLGITTDKNLTWEQQIDLVCRNVSRKLTLMKLLSKYVNQNTLKQYYNSYVLPVFDFGCVVWSKTTNATLTRLVKLKKRAARMILKADFMTPSEQFFKELIGYHSQNGFSIIPASWYIKALPDKIPNISPQCSRMSLNTMRGKPGQQFSIYCTFPDHIQPTLTGHFQFKVQNYGIAYQRILETTHQSIGLNSY